MRQLFPAALLLSLFFFSCKSTQKLYDQGKYERAFYSAIDDLKKNGNNTAAQQVLPDAYAQNRTQLLNTIKSAEAGAKTEDKLDRIYNAYSSLQRMYTALINLPAANRIITGADYSEELANVADEAAAFHYQHGLDLLDHGNKKDAQKAYEDFKITDKYVPGYKDVAQLKAEALDKAITNVVVNNIHQQFGPYAINGSFLENDIINSLNSIGRNYYNQFYPLSEAQFKQVRVDHYMDLQMYDIWFGRLATNTYSYDVSKTIKQPSLDKDAAPQSITVKATVRVTRRIMESRAAMDCRITTADGSRIIFSQRFTSNYTWEKLTGSYTGDPQALTDKDKAIINGAFSNPPEYNELYRELTRQIMNDFDNRMRQLYGR